MLLMSNKDWEQQAHPQISSFQGTLPDSERSSWHRAKSQTLTVVSSEQEQNFKSVRQKLVKKVKLNYEKLHEEYSARNMHKYIP